MVKDIINKNASITWDELLTLWNEARSENGLFKGIKSWIRYLWSYGKMKKYTNLGISVVKEMNLPLNPPKVMK